MSAELTLVYFEGSMTCNEDDVSVWEPEIGVGSCGVCLGHCLEMKWDKDSRPRRKQILDEGQPHPAIVVLQAMVSRCSQPSGPVINVVDIEMFKNEASMGAKAGDGRKSEQDLGARIGARIGAAMVWMLWDCCGPCGVLFDVCVRVLITLIIINLLDDCILVRGSQQHRSSPSYDGLTA